MSLGIIEIIDDTEHLYALSLYSWLNIEGNAVKRRKGFAVWDQKKPELTSFGGTKGLLGILRISTVMKQFENLLCIGLAHATYISTGKDRLLDSVVQKWWKKWNNISYSWFLFP